KEELDSIENSDLYLAKLKKNYTELEKIARERALKLSEKRKASAKILEDAIEKHLTDLEMPQVEFKVDITETELKSNGCDSIRFMISANKGEELKPLSKVASGGELARTILAMKVVLADADSVSTMIFDEIDTGVSGSTSQKIAQKLKTLAKEKQVFVITHSPQIAAFADCHYLVEKREEAGKTVSDVRALSYEESINEVARIISGSTITQAAIDAAKDLKKAGNDE
ncbi:MAG: DNA repair protein RecN, partial [Clostridia bacterium]|nr:DNA repair protein RecN [Clostridia bacterium]